MKRLALFLFVLVLVACGSGLVRLPAPAPTNSRTAFYVYVDPSSTGTAAYAQISAAGFSGIRTIYFPHRWSYAWASSAVAVGLDLLMVTPPPTAADLADPRAYIADMTAGEKLWPHRKWELCNEPDQGRQGAVDVQPSIALTPAQYVTFFQAVIPAMRAADASATLILGGSVGKFGTDPNWISEVSPLWPLVDEVGIHPYPPPWLDNPISTLPAILAAVTQQTGKPAVVTEWGLLQQFAPLLPTDPKWNPLSEPQAAIDIAQMIHTVNGITPLFGIYEWDNNDDPWAATEGFGIAGTPELAAFTSAI